MKTSLKLDGLLRRDHAEQWLRRERKAIGDAVAEVMRGPEGKSIAEAVRGEMQRVFKSPRNNFVRSMRHKLYYRRKEQLPALLIGSRVPWLGLHVRGGTISPGQRMLIPLTEEGRRMKPAAFRRAISGLLNTGNAYFVNKGGKAILMAENLKENASDLRAFRRAERQRSGQKRLKRRHEIPVAVLVHSVRLSARLDLGGIVRARLPLLARAIEARLNRA